VISKNLSKYTTDNAEQQRMDTWTGDTKIHF